MIIIIIDIIIIIIINPVAARILQLYYVQVVKGD